ncbi:MAG: hypothetical protein L7U87_07740 [Chlamydiales bacterium]|nr:hypothetical protein [Chlamydiales bacterium]
MSSFINITARGRFAATAVQTPATGRSSRTRSREARTTAAAARVRTPRVASERVEKEVRGAGAIIREIALQVDTGAFAGKLTDSRAHREIHFQKNRAGKYTVELKGRNFNSKETEILMEALDGKKIASLTVEGRAVFSKADVKGAFRELARLDSVDNTRDKVKSTVYLYQAGSKQAIEILKRSDGADKEVEVLISGDVEDKYINTIVHQLNKNGYSLTLLRKQANVQSRASNILKSRAHMLATTYADEGSIELELENIDELKSIPAFVQGKLFKNELCIRSKDLGTARVVLKRQASRSKDIEVHVLGGSLDKDVFANFMKNVEARPLSLKVKMVYCDTSKGPKKLTKAEELFESAASDGGSIKLTDADERAITELARDGYIRANSIEEKALKMLAASNKAVFDGAKATDNKRLFEALLFPYCLEALLKVFPDNQASFLRKEMQGSLDLSVASILALGDGEDNFNPNYLNLKALFSSPFGGEIDFSFAGICRDFGINPSKIERFTERRDLEVASYRLVDANGDPVELESCQDINRVLDFRITGQTGKAFFNSANSPQDLVEMTTASVVRGATARFNPQESAEHKKRLQKASALKLFLNAFVGGARGPDCSGTFHINFNNNIVSSQNYRDGVKGLASYLLDDSSAESSKGYKFTAGGLFRGSSVSIDEVKALQLITKALGVDILADPNPDSRTAENQTKIQTAIDRLLRGERAVEGRSSLVLEKLLDDLASILDEKYFPNFQVASTPSMAARANDPVIYHYVKKAENSVPTVIEAGMRRAAVDLMNEYPFLVRPDDMEALYSDVVDPALLYKVPGLPLDKTGMGNDLNRRMMAEATKNLLSFNLLEKSALVKQKTSTDGIEKWTLKLDGGLEVSCYTNGKDFSTSHDLSDTDLGLGEKNIAIFKAKEAFDALRGNEKYMLKEQLLFSLTLINENHSLDHEFKDVNLAGFNYLSDRRKGFIAEYRTLRGASKSRVDSAKLAIGQARRLVDKHPLLDTEAISGKLFTNVYGAQRNQAYAGPMEDCYEADGRTTLKDFDGNVRRVPTALKDYMQRRLAGPVAVPVAPAAPVIRTVREDVKLRYFKGKLREQLDAVRASGGRGVKIFADKHRVAVDTDRAIRGRGARGVGLDAIDHHDRNSDSCFYCTIAHAILGVQRGAKEHTTPLGPYTDRVIRELRDAVASYIEDNRQMFLGMVSENPADRAWVSVGHPNGLTIQRRKEIALDAHIAATRHNKWASEVEIQIMSKLLGRQIHQYDTYNRAKPLIHNGIAGVQNDLFDGEPVRITFGGAHFNWLAPKEYKDHVYGAARRYETRWRAGGGAVNDGGYTGDPA